MAKKTKRVVSEDNLKRWEDRVELIKSVEWNLDETEKTKEERIKRARKDYPYFVSTYFPHLAKSECGQFQIDAAKYILANPKARAVFEWPRGHAKSTHISLLIPIWLMIQEKQEMKVMVLVSKSQDAAEGLLSDLQAEIEFNSLLIKDFGSFVSQGEWSKGSFKTSNGCFFKALGRGQTPRGLKNRGNRPDYIIIDDLDDDEMCRNPRRVKDIFDWTLSALIGAFDMGRGRFVMVGNRIHKESVLVKMTKRPKIHHVQVNAYDKDGNVTWKENYTVEEIEDIREFMGEVRFQKEYMNNPINSGTIFREKDIRWGKMLPLREYSKLVCYTDPSFKSSSKNDYKATVLVGLTKTGYYHLIKVFADQTTVSTMIQWHYDIMEFVGDSIICKYYMEANFLQDMILDEFTEKGEEVGHHVPVVGDKRSKPEKLARIEAMQPLFERGIVIFNEEEKSSQGMQVMENQLIDIERGSTTHDDAPDALEGAIFKLSKKGKAGKRSYVAGGRGFSCR